MLKLENLKLKQKSCLRNDGYQVDLNKSTALYVVTNRNCNANCKFCTFCGKSDAVDIEKFKRIYTILYRYFEINTVHFTGGEPTYALDTIKQVCKIAKATDAMTTTSVNTNGLYLGTLSAIGELDNVALSRHGITDTENFEIFGTDTVASTQDILRFPKSKLHLSCNLIKGYVDTEEKVYQYLEMCSKLGVFDVGFVGLMPVNDYCKSHFAEYPTLNRCTSTRSYKNIVDGTTVCECRNWLYRANNCNMISVYHRHAVKSSDILSYLVYENNQLRVGFNGEFIDLGSF